MSTPAVFAKTGDRRHDVVLTFFALVMAGRGIVASLPGRENPDRKVL